MLLLKCVRLSNPWFTDLPATLAAKGVVVHACDFANSAIAAMKGRAGNVTFDTQDVTTMSGKYSESQFDFILDKGCFDSLLCQEAGTLKSQLYIKECNKVLKGDGKMLLITTGAADTRTSYFSDMEAGAVKSLAKPSVNPEAGGAGAVKSLAKPSVNPEAG